MGRKLGNRLGLQKQQQLMQHVLDAWKGYSRQKAQVRLAATALLHSHQGNSLRSFFMRVRRYTQQRKHRRRMVANAQQAINFKRLRFMWKQVLW